MISETKPEQPTSPDDRVTGELNISREEAHQYRTTPWAALWSFYRGDRGRVGLSLLLFTLKHAPVWVWPLFAKQMTRGVEIGGEQGYYMLWTGALVLGLVVAQNVPSHMAFMHLFSRAKRNMEARLRSEIVRRLQQLSIAYHGQTESGRLQAKVLRDVEAVERLSHTLINSLFPGVLGLVFALVVSLVKDPIMAIFFLVAIPIAALLRKVFHLRIRERNREFRTNIEFMSGKVSEMIDMIPITRAHAVEKHEIRRMDDELERVRHRGIRLDMMNAMFRCANWVSFQLIRLSCLAVTSYLALTTTDDTFGLSDVIMYQGLFEVILRSVGQVLNTYPMIAKGFESIHSISEVLDCPDIEHNRGKRKVDDVRGQLDFEHVTFAYPTGDKAIEGFNLHISPGESIAVVGESGAGKS
ncbi:MAG: ABC transporter transmembrane domain-containing protein, partial [Planctomycetota bacterium]